MIKTLHYWGTKATYRVTGKGKIVMLVHGFIEEGSMWLSLARSLSQKYKVIMPDLPGFGKSPVKSRDTVISMAYYADFLRAVCEAEKVKTCCIIGHSMGGYVALYFAEKYPERIWGLGLINSHCFADTNERKANRKRGNAFLKANGSRIFVRELVNRMFHEDYVLKNKDVLRRLTKQAAGYETFSLIAANKAMMEREDKSHVLKNSRVPVLLMSGKEDESVPLEYSLRQATIPDVAHFHLFEKSRHMCLMESTRKAFAAVRYYLSCCDKI